MRQSPCVITSAGEILLPGSGAGIIIVDPWSHQPIVIIDDVGDEGGVAMRIMGSPTAGMIMRDGDQQIEVTDKRQPDYPVRFLATQSADRHGDPRRKFLPK